MWRVVKVCPYCMGGEFEKDEAGIYECINCDTSLEDWELETIDFEE